MSILVGAKDAGVLKQFDEDPALFADDQIELANDELIKILVVLLVAGNETTRNAISGGMQLLIEHPTRGASSSLIPRRSRSPWKRCCASSLRSTPSHEP